MTTRDRLLTRSAEDAQGSISGRNVRKLIDVAVRRGLSRSHLESEARIEPLPSPEERVPVARVIDLWASVMRGVGDPAFPLEVGTSMDLTTYGVFGYLLMTSATLGDALESTCRYLRIIADGFRWVVEKETAASVVLHADGPLVLGRRCMHECVNVELVALGRALLGYEWNPVAVRFAHPAPVKTNAHDDFFRTAVSWGQTRTEVVFERAQLEIPMPKGDEVLSRYFDNAVQERLASLAGPPTSTNVRRILAGGMQGVTVGTIASRLGMSARSLQRQLRDEETTFEALLDDARRTLALDLVGAKKLSLGEIGYILGYSEPSAFHRAFKRWTDGTPGEYREGHR